MPHKTKAGYGKLKGNKFQWKIAKLLSLWWTENKRDDVFIPTGSSGARATNRFKKGKKTLNQDADITSVDLDGFLFIKTFSIEVKFYKKFSLNHLIYKNKDDLYNWWLQASGDAERDNKHPLLILKQNKLPEIIIFEYLLYDSHFYDSFGKIDNKKHIKGLINNVSIIILLLSDFLDYANPTTMKVSPWFTEKQQ